MSGTADRFVLPPAHHARAGAFFAGAAAALIVYATLFPFDFRWVDPDTFVGNVLSPTRAQDTLIGRLGNFALFCPLGCALAYRGFHRPRAGNPPGAHR